MICRLNGLLRVAIVAAWCSTGANARAEFIDGFTEPFRTIRVASPESGIVSRVFVHEGEKVVVGQQLVALDDDVHRLLVEIARQQMEATGRLQSARAEMEMYQGRYAKLAELRSAGQAYQQEVDRARADVEIAHGKLLATEEELALRRLEHKKFAVQLERRTVTAPVNGVVHLISKYPGEYVSPVDPEVVTVVQLDPLRATFLMNRVQASKVIVGSGVTVAFTDANLTARGVVEHVSELTDAESGTVPVRVRIENSEGKYRSGERCTLEVK